MQTNLTGVEAHIFGILVSHAINRETTNYESLAAAVGRNLPTSGSQLGQVLSPILSNIFRWCEAHNLPYLTSIVVRKSGAQQGIPGAGFWELYYEDDAMREATLEQKREVIAELHADVFQYYSMGQHAVSLGEAIELIHVARSAAAPKLRKILGCDRLFYYDVRKLMVDFLFPSIKKKPVVNSPDKIEAVGYAISVAQECLNRMTVQQRNAISNRAHSNVEQALAFWGEW